MSDDTDFDPTNVTIHTREKVSTGDYENMQQDITVEFDVPDDMSPAEFREEYSRWLKRLQKDIQRAVENRIKIDSQEDWTHEMDG